MKECLSVSFASKDGWVLAFSDRHCGLLPVGSLITQTHTHNKYIYIYICIHRCTQLYVHIGVTREFVMSMRY